MANPSNCSQDLLSYLRTQGPTLSSQLIAHFEISRATLSRRVNELGEAIIRIGKGRATQLAARHEDASKGVPLYQVQASGQVRLIGRLIPIRAGSQTQWFLQADALPRALTEEEFKDGLYPGWPWFLDDLRPAGFLGRAFGKFMAEIFQIDENPEKWSDLELLKTLVNYGFNLPGNFILGDGRALSYYQKHRAEDAKSRFQNITPGSYPKLAKLSLEEGEEYGSSAGGEQPKLTAMVTETPGANLRAVIVKFSPKLDTASATGRRWADLLHAEHIANQVLRKAGFATARTRILHIEDRIFLESERFDRVGPSGRRGLVSLRALDAAYVGQGGGSWANCARKLHAGKWITAEDRDRMVQLHCFGELIANTDMHFGNLSFFLSEEAPYPLAPVYDMLPMQFRPSGTGEIVQRHFKPALPKPEDHAIWLETYPHAIHYWRQVRQCPDISPDFQMIAEQAIKALQRIHKIATA